MGVKGLRCFLQNYTKNALVEHKLSNCRVLIDGNNLAIHIFYKLTPAIATFGGDYDEYVHQIHIFFNELARCRVEACVMMDGGLALKQRSLDSAVKRLTRDTATCMTELNLNNNSPCALDKMHCVYPPAGLQVFMSAVRHHGVTVLQADHLADDELAIISCTFAIPVISMDSDFSLRGVSLIYLDTMEYHDQAVAVKKQRPDFIRCTIFDPDAFCQDLGINRQHMLFIDALAIRSNIATFCMNKFIRTIASGRTRKADCPWWHYRLLVVARWLVRHGDKTVPELIDLVLQTLPRYYARGNDFRKVLGRIVNLWPRASRLLPWFTAASDGVTCSGHTAYTTHCVVGCPHVVTDAEVAMLAKKRERRMKNNVHQFNIIDEMKKVEDGTCPHAATGTVFAGGMPLPAWFTINQRQYFIHFHAAELFVKKIIFALPVVEKFNQKSCYMIVLPILKLMLAISEKTYIEYEKTHLQEQLKLFELRNSESDQAMVQTIKSEMEQHRVNYIQYQKRIRKLQKKPSELYNRKRKNTNTKRKNLTKNKKKVSSTVAVDEITGPVIVEVDNINNETCSKTESSALHIHETCSDQRQQNFDQERYEVYYIPPDINESEQNETGGSAVVAVEAFEVNGNELTNMNEKEESEDGDHSSICDDDLLEISIEQLAGKDEQDESSVFVNDNILSCESKLETTDVADEVFEVNGNELTNMNEKEDSEDGDHSSICDDDLLEMSIEQLAGKDEQDESSVFVNDNILSCENNELDESSVFVNDNILSCENNLETTDVITEVGDAILGYHEKDSYEMNSYIGSTNITEETANKSLINAINLLGNENSYTCNVYYPSNTFSNTIAFDDDDSDADVVIEEDSDLYEYVVDKMQLLDSSGDRPINSLAEEKEQQLDSSGDRPINALAEEKEQQLDSSGDRPINALAEEKEQQLDSSGDRPISALAEEKVIIIETLQSTSSLTTKTNIVEGADKSLVDCVVNSNSGSNCKNKSDDNNESYTFDGSYLTKLLKQNDGRLDEESLSTTNGSQSPGHLRASLISDKTVSSSTNVKLVDYLEFYIKLEKNCSPGMHVIKKTFSHKILNEIEKNFNFVCKIYKTDLKSAQQAVRAGSDGAAASKESLSDNMNARLRMLMQPILEDECDLYMKDELAKPLDSDYKYDFLSRQKLDADQIIKYEDRPLKWYFRKSFLRRLMVVDIMNEVSEATVPSLISLSKMNVQQRKDLLCDFLQIPLTIYHGLPNDLQLVFLCIFYWYKNSNFKIDRHHVYTLLVCIIMFYFIDGCIGRIRNEDELKYLVKTETCSAKKQKRKTLRLLKVTPLYNLNYIKHNLDRHSCAVAALNLREYHDTPKLTKRNFKLEAVHTMGEFQALYTYIGALNSFLCGPFLFHTINEFWSGTFAYNVFRAITTSSNIGELLATKLGENLQMTFLLDAFQDYIGNLLLLPMVLCLYPKKVKVADADGKKKLVYEVNLRQKLQEENDRIKNLNEKKDLEIAVAEFAELDLKISMKKKADEKKQKKNMNYDEFVAQISKKNTKVRRK